MNKRHHHLLGFLGMSALCLLGIRPAVAELSAEHKHRVRGEMREMWSRMTPEERDSLQREYVASKLEDSTVSEVTKSTPRVVERQRQLSTEEHHFLRRQLRDISPESRR